MASETSKELIAWFEPSTADISEYLEDTVQYVLDSPFDHWKDLAVCWHTKDKEWKETVSAILDKIDDQRRLVLLQELLKSRSSEDCATVATLVSQLECRVIPKDLLELIQTYLKGKWEELPKLRKYIEVACKACGLELDVTNDA